MSYTTRIKARRELKRAAELCDNVQKYFARLDGIYSDTHEDIGQSLHLLGISVERIKTSILELRDYL